jgi:hypothetical protein
MDHDYVITERVRVGAYELVSMIGAHLGKAIPNGATITTSRMRDGVVTDILVSWDTPKELLEVDGEPTT